MRKRLYLTIEKEVYNFLKQRRLNISRYVEKLIVKDSFGKSLSETPVSLVLTRVRILLPASHSLRSFDALRIILRRSKSVLLFGALFKASLFIRDPSPRILLQKHARKRSMFRTSCSSIRVHHTFF